MRTVNMPLRSLAKRMRKGGLYYLTGAYPVHNSERSVRYVGSEEGLDLQLNGRRALISGASQGIGYAIAHTLAKEGAFIAIVARREPALSNAKAMITRECGHEVVAVQGDIRKAEDCERIVAQATAALGGLDILINNDGAPPLGPSLNFSDADWSKAVDQNFMSVLRMTRAAVPHMKTAGGGAVVNITALSAIQPVVGFGLSVATWAAVIGLAKTLSRELAPDNIRINTLCPGATDTPRVAKVNEQTGGMMDKLIAEIPLGRIAKPEQIAALVALLASPLGSHMTGATIPIDGGQVQALL
jgi:3-oxoacyl-[acyl-carrier protein] reductase